MAETVTIGGVAPMRQLTRRLREKRANAIGACVVPMFQTRIRQDAPEFGVEEEETIFKRGKAPSEAISGRVTYATMAAGVKAPPSIVGEI